MSYFFGTPLSMQPMRGDYTRWESTPPSANYIPQDRIPENAYTYIIPPPSRIIGKYWWQNFDFSSVPGLATLSGTLSSPISFTIAGEFPAWTADVVIDCRSAGIAGDFPVWTSSVHILTGEILTIAGEFPSWTGVIYSLGGHSNIVGTFPKWSSVINVLSGEILSISGEFPIWTSSIIITPDVGLVKLYGTFPSWSGLLRLREIIEVYAATVMNASNFAVTEYAQYPVSALGYMNKKYYGVLSDGIYLLDGDTDNGTNIDAEIETGPLDLWMGGVKYPREAWFVFRADGTVILRIRVDEQDAYEQEVAYLHERIHEGRVKFAKGLRKRFAAFGFRNKDGADFDLSNIRVMVDVVPRKR